MKNILWIIFVSSLNFCSISAKASDSVTFISFDEFEKEINEIDDNKRLQRAVKYCHEKGIDTLFFPKGTYHVYHTIMYPGQVFLGEKGTVLKKRPMSGKWARMFTTKGLYKSEKDSELIVFSNITFDGNKDEQGPYKKFQLQQQHILFFDADPSLPGRIRGHVENCLFQNSVADGISTWKNSHVTVKDCKAFNVFRGGVVACGGNSILEIDGLETGGEDDLTGIDIEVDGKGYGGKKDIHITAKNMIIGGDLDIGFMPGSSFFGDNIRLTKPKMFLKCYDSTIKFTNSTFNLGGRSNLTRVFFPKNILFEDCDFFIKGENDRTAGFKIFFEANYYSKPGHSLKFKNCNFTAENNSSGKVVAFNDVQNSRNSESNFIDIDNCTFEGDFNLIFTHRKGGNVKIRNSYFEAETIFKVNTLKKRSKFTLNADYLILADNVSTLMVHKFPNKSDEIKISKGVVFEGDKNLSYSNGDIEVNEVGIKESYDRNFVVLKNRRVKEIYDMALKRKIEYKN